MNDMTTCPMCGRIGLHACSAQAAYPTPHSYQTGNRPRCECHDCTQARGPQIVLTGAQSFPTTTRKQEIITPREPTARDQAIKRLIRLKPPEKISEDDIQLAMVIISDERERCAKIADKHADDPHGSNPSCATGEAIAAEIRSGE